MSIPPPDLLRRVAAASREGYGAVACLIVGHRGSTPQSAGALMFVDELGRLSGTIGGGCIEADVRRRAMPMIERKQSAILKFRLDGDYGWDDGLICGGTIEVAVAPAPSPETLEEIAAAIEQRRATRLDLDVRGDGNHERITLRIPSRPRLYIAGAGHIGQATARLAVALDFDVTIFDDRPDLLARFTEPLRTVCGPIAQRLSQAAIDRSTYCLIVTRGHRHDAQALAAVLERAEPGDEPQYIGMIGSRRKVAVTYDELESRGIARERLNAICAPVGLPIGSQTVEEIAISIAAQLVQVRAQGHTKEGVRRRDLIERVAMATTNTPVGPALIGVLLAAGQSRRMGQTKQTLPLPDDPQQRTLAAAAFDAIAPQCSQMVVVVAHEAPAVRAALGGRSFAEVASTMGAEMFESILVGLRQATRIDPAAPVLLHLADHPRVNDATLAAILQASQSHPDRAIMPTFDGKGGHPVLIPASLVPAILDHGAAGESGGLRKFWAAHPQRCLRLPVDDASVLLDIDSPHDYRDRLQGAI